MNDTALEGAADLVANEGPRVPGVVSKILKYSLFSYFSVLLWLCTDSCNILPGSYSQWRIRVEVRIIYRDSDVDVRL